GDPSGDRPSRAPTRCWWRGLGSTSAAPAAVGWPHTLQTGPGPQGRGQNTLATRPDENPLRPKPALTGRCRTATFIACCLRCKYALLQGFCTSTDESCTPA